MSSSISKLKKICFAHYVGPQETRGWDLLSRDYVEFSRDLGFEPIISTTLRIKYFRLICTMLSADVFLAAYPILFGPYFVSPRARIVTNLNKLFWSTLLKANRKVRSILFVYDLPLDQWIFQGIKPSNDAYRFESSFLSSFDILCVFNNAMKKVISQRYKIPNNRFVEFELLDCRARFTPPVTKKIDRNNWRIIYSGNADQQYVGRWLASISPAKNLTYEVLGPYGDWISSLGRPDVEYHGFIVDKISELTSRHHEYLSSRADFGIIKYTDQMKMYCRYSSTSKFSSYVSAGLPVLVPDDYQYITRLVRKYDVGLTFSSLDEVPEILRGLTTAKYQQMRNNCLCLSEKLSNGYFFKRALKLSLKKLALD